MSARLHAMGVPVDEYYPGDDGNPVNHEFQLRLSTPEATEALELAVAFLTRVTSAGPAISH